MISKVYLKFTNCYLFAVQMCARERERKIEVERYIVCVCVSYVAVKYCF